MPDKIVTQDVEKEAAIKRNAELASEALLSEKKSGKGVKPVKAAEVQIAIREIRRKTTILKTETIILQVVVHFPRSSNPISQSQIMDKNVKVE